MRRQRPVGPRDLPRAVVHHDVVTDGIDVFHPLPFGPLQLRKAPEVLERERGMARERPQQPLFLDPETPSLAKQAERSQLLFVARSEEHTSELQSLTNLVCRLLLEKKKLNY